MNIQSKLLASVPGLIHGFGTREEPLPQPFVKDWDLRRPRWRQVHGMDWAWVQTQGQECGEVDALYSRESGIPVAVVTADCVPILMANQSGKCVAAIHAGWRGTRAHIVRKLWSQLQSQGERPENWTAAIGPAIGPCCYEVSVELAEDFQREFGFLGEGIAVPRSRILDLPAIQAGELRHLGIGQIDLLRFCTRCSTTPPFHSYRREGGGTRQWSVICCP